MATTIADVLKYWKNKQKEVFLGYLVFPDMKTQVVDLTDDVYFETILKICPKAIGLTLYMTSSDSWAIYYLNPSHQLCHGTTPRSKDVIVAICDVIKHYFLTNSRHQRQLEDKVYALEFQLKEHNWYYENAEDNSTWRAGRASYQEILRLLKLVTLEEGQRLWKQYAPPGFEFPESGS